MKTNELIEFLRKNKTDINLWEEVIGEIIERLKELEWFREEKKIEDATWK